LAFARSANWKNRLPKAMSASTCFSIVETIFRRFSLWSPKLLFVGSDLVPSLFFHSALPDSDHSGFARQPPFGCQTVQAIVRGVRPSSKFILPFRVARQRPFGLCQTAIFRPSDGASDRKGGCGDPATHRPTKTAQPGGQMRVSKVPKASRRIIACLGSSCVTECLDFPIPFLECITVRRRNETGTPATARRRFSWTMTRSNASGHPWRPCISALN
jgi:hypothetical protein